MRKRICAVLLLISLLLTVSACWGPKERSFAEGTYELDQQYADLVHPEYSAVRVELKAIDEKAYQAAEGVNVIMDYAARGRAKYYSIELQLCDRETEAWFQVDIGSVVHQPGAPQTYYLKTRSLEDSYGITNMTFIFDANVRTVLYQNGEEYHFFQEAVS